MSKKSLIWKIPTAIVGCLLGLVLVLLVAVGVVIVTPSARQAVLNKAVAIANEKTDYDIDLGRIYLSPFHHSPMLLYRAYKGKADLPLEVEIDSLFVGHRGQDTLAYVRTLRLKATAKTANLQSPIFNLQFPIAVDTLQLESTTFHSDSLIASVGVDAIVDHLALSSPDLCIAEGRYPLHGLRLYDAHVGIDLRDTPPHTTAKDTTPLLLAFDLPDGELRNIRFRLTPLGLEIRTGSLSTNALVDVGANRYDARRLNVGDFTYALGALRIPADTIYGNACVELNSKLITSDGLHVRSEEMGARADLTATKMNLETMRVDVTGQAEYQGSRARLRASYDIDDEAYDATVHLDRVDLSPFVSNLPPLILAGDIEAQGKGIDPSSRAMRSKVRMRMSEAVYDNINVSGIALDAELKNKTVAGTLHLPVSMKDSALAVKAQTEHQFSLSDFLTPQKMTVDYHTHMRNIRAHVAGEDFKADRLTLDFTTDSTTALDLNTPGLNISANCPMQLMTLIDRIRPLSSFDFSTALEHLDSLCRLLPPLQASLALRQGSPIQHYIDSTRVELDRVSLDIASTEERTNVLLAADARLTDGAMSFFDLCADASLRMTLNREGSDLNGNGQLKIDSIFYNNKDLGSHDISFSGCSDYDLDDAAYGLGRYEKVDVVRTEEDDKE